MKRSQPTKLAQAIEHFMMKQQKKNRKKAIRDTEKTRKEKKLWPHAKQVCWIIKKKKSETFATSSSLIPSSV